MKKIRNILAAEMYASIIVSLVIILLYETEVLLPGGMSDNANMEFLAVSGMEIITICMIPLSLKLLKLNGVKARLKQHGAREYIKWGSIRMAMICVPMMVNTLMYYVAGLNVAFGYMGIICFVCLAFIYPSETRCANETRIEE